MNTEGRSFMARGIGIALIAVGVALLILGFQAADSPASQISEFFTGTPTDRAVWMLIGGIVSLIVGAVMSFRAPRF
jgi:multisubunit Na+/H+ antiporter MnhB subunit